MWDKGHQSEILDKYNAVEEMFKCVGELTEEEAGKILSNILEQNLTFAWELMSQGKLKLYDWQSIILRGWMKKDYSLMVAGRGCSKSYLIAIFCLLYCQFNENAKVIIVANNFRRVKDIFAYMESFLKKNESVLLRQCFADKVSKATDHYILKCNNGSYIKGLPLSGEGLRGERANVLIIDEGLLISKFIQETILRPFLVAKLNSTEYAILKEEEDLLIKRGLLKEEDRTPEPKNKLIITSSASFKFEYLYEVFDGYKKIILDEHRKRELADPSYFVVRMSFEAVPEGTILDDSVMKAAAESNNGTSVTFQREYRAIFPDNGGSYFDIKKLNECTYPEGELPTVQIYGEKDAKYLLTIDPAYGSSDAGDYFAMGVYMLYSEERKIVQVHSYGQAGKDIKEQFEYLVYILKNFNVEMVGIDASGDEFIKSFNHSVIAKKNNISLDFIKAPVDDPDDFEYRRAIDNARGEWNKETGAIVFPIQFSATQNRRMNEYLQGGISSKKVWFASPICKHDQTYNTTIHYQLPLEIKDEYGESYSMATFLDAQDDWISNTKKQLALIEVSATENGTFRYQLPSSLRRNKDPKRARRDNYTTLLMGYTLSKYYFDITAKESNAAPSGFVPFFC